MLSDATSTLRASDRRAFTLIEALVVIAVVAILLGITIPVLRGALERSKEVNDLANLRSTHQQFFEWGVDHHDRFVNKGPTRPGEPFTIRIGEHPGYIQAVYSAQIDYWNWTLGEWLGRGYPTWHPTGLRPLQEHELAALQMMVPLAGYEHFRPSGFVLSRPMLYDPRLFMPGCPEAHSMARYVRWSEARHPGAKVLLFHEDAMRTQSGAYPVDDPRVAVALVDGSARYVSPFEAITIPGEPCSEHPFARTPLGVLGRDLP